jgi:hypothetical protein
MAEGGGDFTVVSILPVVVTVLVEVDSVIIGSVCAWTRDINMTKPTPSVSFLII